jgi:hypothetical protein
VIAQTQATLSRLQGTPEAWGLARILLEKPDQQVKFFGALTIVIKLNNERYSSMSLLLLLAGLSLNLSLVHPSHPKMHLSCYCCWLIITWILYAVEVHRWLPGNSHQPLRPFTSTFTNYGVVSSAISCFA